MAIIGHDVPFDPELHSGMGKFWYQSFYEMDIKPFISHHSQRLGVELNFIPMKQLSNQKPEIPKIVWGNACEVENTHFIGVIRDAESLKIHFWVTGYNLGNDGEEYILPSDCYSNDGQSASQIMTMSALAKAMGGLK